MSNSCNPMDDSLPGYSVCCPWDFPGKNTGLPFPSPEYFPNLEIEPGSPALQVDSLTD